MPTALPAASAFTGSTVTEGDFKSAITNLRSFLADLLGGDGVTATALTTIGSPLNGVLSKSAAYTVTTTDRGKLIDATTGTWTLSLPAAATAGAGFVIGVRNSGTGVITIDPNLSELVDGATTKALSGEAAVLVVCTGSAWKTVGQSAGSDGELRNVRVYTSGATWTKPTGLKRVRVIVQAGGGGGGGGNTSSAIGGGGGAGAWGARAIEAASLSATETVTVGAAGVGQSSAGGTSGGTSSFGTLLSCTGGGGGQGGTSSGGGSGGTATSADYAVNGQAGDVGTKTADGGCSPFGGWGRAAAATGWGSGGAGRVGGVGGGTGYSGRQGIVIVEEYL